MLSKVKSFRFAWLFLALIIMIASYPSFGDTTTGAALGQITSLLVLGTGVYAIRAHRKTRVASLVLAVVALASSVVSLLFQVRGGIWGEATYTAFYAFATVAVFVEVIRPRRFDADAILGIVSVYLLIGVAFGSLYDALETLHPGSFVLNVSGGTPEHLGFRPLLFYSFMTLTSVGYGDITPVTERAQSPRHPRGRGGRALCRGSGQRRRECLSTAAPGVAWRRHTWRLRCATGSV